MSLKMTVHVVGRDDSVAAMFHKRGFEVVRHTTASVLCFTGGADVSPLLYGETQLRFTYTDPERDAEEIHVLRNTEYLRTQGQQVAVGICRGGQFLNVMAGGKLWQDVDNHGRHHQALDRLTGKLVTVTSTHHQMMIPHEADGQVLLVANEARSKMGQHDQWLIGPGEQEYGDVEAVWYERQKFLCYQPHPEYSNRECEQLFFDYLIPKLEN